MHHGQEREAAFLRLDLPGDATRLLRRHLGVVEREPGVDEPPRRVPLEHVDLVRELPVVPRLAHRLVRLDGDAVEVLGCELRLHDRVPHGLRRRLHEHLVDLGRLHLGHRGHAVSSSSVLSSASADTRRSVYLSIHRSWISRIGTGLRKCSFSRPCRRVTTSPASSSTRRCFITPKRVISRSDSSSPSERPSRSKSRSRRKRRVGSASALKTRSSSMRGEYVTKWSHVKLNRTGCRDASYGYPEGFGPRKGESMHRIVRKPRLTAAGLAAVVIAAVALIAAGPASSKQDDGYTVHNLVSDQPGVADHMDPNLVNPWGIAASSSSPWWVSDNGMDVSTLYNGNGEAQFPPTPLVVSVPGGPTGTVFNGSTGFVISDGTNSGPARFLFATEAGTIRGW